MKIKFHTLAILFPLLFASSIFAQGNLQFNQAINIKMTASPVSISSGSTKYYLGASNPVTVPAGKVWKIESMNVGVTGGSHTSANSLNELLFGNTYGPVIFLDDVPVYSLQHSNSVAEYHQITWLPAGAHTFEMWIIEEYSPVTYSQTALISILEFNIVP